MSTNRDAARHSGGLGRIGLVVALFVAAMFAANVVAMKVVVDATAPLLSVALRMAVVLLLCLPALRLVAGRNRVLALYGFLNGGLFLVLMNIALSMATNVGPLALAGQLSVPFSLLLGALVFRDRLSGRKTLGVVLAFAGVAALVFDPHIAGEVPAMLVMAAAAMIWGGATLLQRRLGGISVMTIQAWNGLMGAAVLLPIAFVREGDELYRLAQLGWTPIGWFAFSVVGSTIAGQGALAWLLQRYPISSVMPIMLASPVMATVFASLYFGTRITPVMIAGGLLALFGVAMILLMRDPPVGGAGAAWHSPADVSVRRW